MKILFISNNAGGFADHIDIDDNTTVGQFFASKMPNEASANYVVRVNREPVASDYVLQDGDRLTITPSKIQGAHRRAA